MSATHKYGIRYFTDGPTPPLKDFIPVFHGWIQRRALPNHQLIDVHDYSHVTGGPGILLVAYEANLNFNGRSLTYLRKQPGSLVESLAHARQAVKLLELPFAASPFEVFVNDRLATVAITDIAVATGGTVTVKHGDPRERLTFVVQL